MASDTNAPAPCAPDGTPDGASHAAPEAVPAVPPDDPVCAQYEAFPYPARDPAEERGRLIEGSPSHPVEIDHFLFAGKRDWTRPFRALVAGGGTGDGLVMLAQRLSDIGCQADITYLDLSSASRAVAEARIAARGLSVRFVTDDLRAAPSLAAADGPFDYIDCCGVLHHLDDPDSGFAALAEAVAPDGGLGLMVYAPHGRTGVYALQAAFGALLAGDPPAEKPALARQVLAGLPATNWLSKNTMVSDHVTGGDAGLYDLLLHARDRPYTIDALAGALTRAGLSLVAPVEAGRYDPARYLAGAPEVAARARALPPLQAMAVAEHLAGNMKTHVVYAVPAGRGAVKPAGPGPEAVAHLRGAAPTALAQAISRDAGLTLSADGLSFRLRIPRAAAAYVAAADGRRSLGQIAERSGRDWLAFAADWAPAARELAAFGLMHYSRGARR